MGNHIRKHTDAQVATWRAMWADGATYQQISDATGISVSALGSSRGRYGMAPRVRPPSTHVHRPTPESIECRKRARSGSTLEQLPSLAGIDQSLFKTGTTDAKMVSRKYLPEHMCAWPIGEPGSADFHLCGDHCRIPGPYCNDHRLSAYLSPEESNAAWTAVLGKHPRKL